MEDKMGQRTWDTGQVLLNLDSNRDLGFRWQAELLTGAWYAFPFAWQDPGLGKIPPVLRNLPDVLSRAKDKTLLSLSLYLSPAPG